MTGFLPMNDRAEGTHDETDRLFDYTVVTNDGQKLGKVENIWMDVDSKRGFVAVSTGWFFGRQCLIPTTHLDIDHAASMIRVPFSKDTVKNSPDVAADYTVTDEEAQLLMDYYDDVTPGSTPREVE